MYSNESYLIELLTQAGYLNEEILQYARSQKSPTQDLVDFLIQANYLTEDVIAQVAASNSLLPVVDLGSMHIPQEVRELITPELARRFRAIPISDDGFSINIAIDDPLNLETMDSLPQLMGRDVIFSVATRSAVESRLNEFYRDLSVPEETDGLEGEDAPIIRLVQQMLDLSRMENSTAPLNLEPVDMVPFVRSIVNGQERLFADRDLRLRFADETQGHDDVVEADPDMITQCVINLLSNAMRYTPEGGWVVVSVLSDRKHVDIAVSDTGIGIAKDDLSRIFGRFWRADASRAREAGGLGVGLAVTKQIVERHHGYISVESELGKGTTFTIHLPREHTADAASTTMEH